MRSEKTGISIYRTPSHNNVKTSTFQKTSTVNSDAIKEALKQVKYPGFSRDIVSFGLVKSAAFADGTAKVSLTLTTADPKVPLHLKKEVESCLRALPGVTSTIVDLSLIHI